MSNPTLKTLQKLDLIILDIESLMVSLKDDELLQVYRRTINLELASAMVEILDAKAIIYALYPLLIDQIDQDPRFDAQFYQKHVQKNIPVKNWDISNTDLFKRVQDIYLPSKNDDQLNLLDCSD